MSDIINQLRKQKADKVVEIRSRRLEKPEDTQSVAEPKSNSLLSRLKSKSEESMKLEIIHNNDKEKLEIKQEYINILNSQQYAYNLVLNKISKVVSKYTDNKIKLDESYKMDGVMLIEELQKKAIERAERKTYHMRVGNSVMSSIVKDITSGTQNKIQEISVLTPEDIELVRRIKLTENDYVITTDENEYRFDGNELGRFGGYLYIRRQILTEVLESYSIVEKIAKGGKSAVESETLMWLLLNPLRINTPEGKTLLINPNYMKAAVQDLMTKVITNKSSIEKINKNELETESEQQYYNESDVKIVERFMETTTLPKRNDVAWFPFHLLQESGVEVDIEFDYNKSNYTRVLDSMDEERVDYIPLKDLESIGTYRKIVNLLNEFTSSANKVITRHVAIKEVYSVMDRDAEMLESIAEEIVEREENKLLDIEDKSHSPNEETDDEIEGMLKDIVNSYIAEPDGDLSDISSVVNKKLKQKLKSRLTAFVTALKDFAPENLTNAMNILNSEINLPFNLEFELERSFKALNKLITVDIFTVKENEDMRMFGYKVESETINDNINVQLDRVGSREDLETLRDEFGDIIEEYKYYVSKMKEIQTVINTTTINPFLQNLTANVTQKYGEKIEVAGVMLDALKKIDQNLDIDIANIPKQYIPVINHNLNSKGYPTFKKLILHYKGLGNLDSVDWYEVFKLCYLEHLQLLPLKIKLTPSIKQLLPSNEFRTLLTTLNNAGRFIENDGRISKTALSFNLMMSDLVNNYTSLICSIDYEGLTTYISLLESNNEEMEGSELIKYIPALKVVNKHFPIQDNVFTLKPLDESRYMEELSNLPMVYIGLNFIMSKIALSLKLKDSIFSDSLADLQELNKLRVQVQRNKVNIKLHGEITSIEVKYDLLRKELNKILSEDTLYKKNPYVLGINSLEKDLLMVSDPMWGIDIHLAKYDDKLKEQERIKYKERKESQRKYVQETINTLKNYDKELINLREEMKYEQIKNKEQLLKEIKEVNERIKDKVGKESDHIVKNIIESYSSEDLKNVVFRAWNSLGLTKFQKGRALYSFINNFIETNSNSEVIQASVYAVIQNFLTECNRMSKSLQQTKKPAEIVEYLFNFICFQFKLQDVFRLNTADKLELDDAFNIKEDLTEEEKTMLTNLFSHLQDIDESKIPITVKNFARKDLLSDELYQKLVYSNDNELERAYPQWYNSDFSLAENLKIMIECGISKGSFNSEHLADERLMEIVDNIQVSPDIIENVKKFL